MKYINSRYDLDQIKEFNKKGYARAKQALGLEKAWPTHISGYVSPSTGPNGDFSYWKGAKHE